MPFTIGQGGALVDARAFSISWTAAHRPSRAQLRCAHLRSHVLGIQGSAANLPRRMAGQNLALPWPGRRACGLRVHCRESFIEFLLLSLTQLVLRQSYGAQGRPNRLRSPLFVRLALWQQRVSQTRGRL